ncbi:MAG: DedA family protein [Planctomycetota bacterium]|jgi:membrane protein DedA with SNARE-associated domain
MLQSIWDWLIGAIGKLGYTGIVALMALESSFFPFPSEVVVPPGGALADKGEMSLFLVIASGIVGSIIGALFNYWLALKLGRPFFLRYGKYILVSEKKFRRSEEFFRRHGEIGTFIGRLIPGVRQIISFPAGLARMNLGRFCFFTAVGSGIWVTVLAFIGYWVGADLEVVKPYAKTVLLYMAPALILIILGYVVWHLKFRRRDGEESPDTQTGEADR